MRFVQAMETTTGRVARIVAGLVLIGLGVWLSGGWLALVAVGLVPVAAGVFNFCLAAPLFGEPLRHIHHGV